MIGARGLNNDVRVKIEVESDLPAHILAISADHVIAANSSHDIRLFVMKRGGTFCRR
jgi:hypothetical protein